MAILPAIASAGQWVQVSCRDPNGNAATNQGWTSSSNTPTPGSVNDDNCSPSQPMVANLSANNGDAASQSYELLSYAPPAGSTLAGGTINISGSVYGINGSSAGASNGTSVAYSPNFTYDSGDIVYQCAHSQNPCQSDGAYDYTAQVALPSNEGGGVYLEAGCGGGANCSAATSQNGIFSQISLSSADLLLSNASTPAGSGFSGTLLGADPPSSASLLFTATDENGPGVYSVNVNIDGTSVYSGTPNTNGGTCTSVGTYAGTSAMEFDSAQPCPQSEGVDIPVSTSGLSSGSHEVTATVTDAAGNTATVLDQDFTIPAPASTTTTGTTTTPAPVTTPTPKPTKKGVREVKAKFSMDWHFVGSVSRLLKVTAAKLPKTAKIVLTDSGPRHPRIKPASATAKNFQKLMRVLERLKFVAGDRLTMTINVKGEKSERIRVTIRKGKVPTATLLKYR